MISLRNIAKKFNKPALSQEAASSMLFDAMTNDDGDEVLRVAQLRPDSVYWPGFGGDPTQDKALIPFDYALRFNKRASAGAMAAAVPELLTDETDSGRTRLFLDILNAYETPAPLTLVDIGADIHKRDKAGNTLLHAAATVKESDKPVQIAFGLLKEADLKNDKGETPLMTAAANGAGLAAAFLLNNDAEINAADKQGLNATMHAIIGKQPQTAHMLMLLGGEIDFSHPAAAPGVLQAAYPGMAGFLKDAEQQRRELAERQAAAQAAQARAQSEMVNAAIVSSLGTGVGEVSAPRRAAFRKKNQPPGEI